MTGLVELVRSLKDGLEQVRSACNPNFFVSDELTNRPDTKPYFERDSVVAKQNGQGDISYHRARDQYSER